MLVKVSSATHDSSIHACVATLGSRAGEDEHQISIVRCGKGLAGVGRALSPCSLWRKTRLYVMVWRPRLQGNLRGCGITTCRCMAGKGQHTVCSSAALLPLCRVTSILSCLAVGAARIA
jgi:hypothetical protein